MQRHVSVERSSALTGLYVEAGPWSRIRSMRAGTWLVRATQNH